MKVVAVIQARMGSSRLPGKSLMPISNVPLLELVIRSAKKNFFIDDIIVATTTEPEDSLIVDYCNNNKISFYRGDPQDVLDRFIKLARVLNHEDIIVRITADNPLNNHAATKKLFYKHLNEGNDYTFVEGLSHLVYEFMTVLAILKLSSCKDLTNYDREHVTPYFRENDKLFKTASLTADELGLNSNLDRLLTIDTAQDYLRFKRLSSEFDLDDYLNFDIIYKWLLKDYLS